MSQNLPPVARALLSVCAIVFLGMVLLSLITQRLLLPYERDSSLFDFASAIAVLAGGVLAAASRAEATASGPEAPTTFASGAAVVAVLFAVAKAAILAWGSLGPTAVAVSGLLLALGPVCLAGSAVQMRRGQAAARHDMDALADRYAKLMDGEALGGEEGAGKKEGVDDDEAPELSIWQVRHLHSLHPAIHSAHFQN